MKYYLVKNGSNERLPIGEISFNKLYVEYGWEVFIKMVVSDSMLELSEFHIRRDDKKNILSVEEFVSEIEKYEIIT